MRSAKAEAECLNVRAQCVTALAAIEHEDAIYALFDGLTNGHVFEFGPSDAPDCTVEDGTKFYDAFRQIGDAVIPLMASLLEKGESSGLSGRKTQHQIRIGAQCVLEDLAAFDDQPEIQAKAIKALGHFGAYKAQRHSRVVT